MERSRPIVLSIAGLDPSAGAGLLADIKTYEEHKVYGLGICTAQTIQTENEFISIRWQDEKEILKATEVMLSNYDVKAVKIGIVENIARLKTMVEYIHKKDPGIKIVWDTVIKSSTGFGFWMNEVDQKLLKEILVKVFLITPNYNEVVKLVPFATPKEAANMLSSYCHVLLKGGHNEEEVGSDYLYTKSEAAILQPNISTVSAKHGSGCVLSSAIAANLALGNGLHTSCDNAKRYIERFLSSNNSLLGYHHV